MAANSGNAYIQAIWIRFEIEFTWIEFIGIEFTWI